MQAAVNYPLTVHGTGGQTRAFIHIQDTVRCIQLAIENPPARGERVQVFNQMTETHRVRDLAKLVSELTGAEIDYVDNPRKEDAENDLFVANDNFLELGLKPTTLRDDLLNEVTEIASPLRRVAADLAKVPCTSKWIQRQPVASAELEGFSPAARSAGAAAGKARHSSSAIIAAARAAPSTGTGR